MLSLQKQFMQTTMSNFFLIQSRNLIVALYAVKSLNISMITAGRQLRIFPFSSSTAIWSFTKDVMSAPAEKKFYETYDFLPRYFQRTNRLTWKIADLLRNASSLKSIAQMTNVSVTTVCRILDSIDTIFIIAIFS